MMSEQDKIEKVTVNVGIVDLGQIDLLVDQAFYSNRTDFVRTAIRNQLETHRKEIQDYTTRKITAVGVVIYDRDELEILRASKTKIEIRLIGQLVIAKDVDAGLIRDTVEHVQHFGVLKASNEVKAVIKEIQSKG
ncbi:CopG family transcriptional regulator [Paenibacillus sp. Marseille-Q4541]|uniref:CopG family transcriptional regulator n=1 Tax=Paenibacillus sp. Marseille-Q4541 TaxID=2831522 RepID=UPI001BA8AA7C|nr:CopG family transcriptional regulator [Paenibacillus sp. Marseille-Q4541]